MWQYGANQYWLGEKHRCVFCEKEICRLLCKRMLYRTSDWFEELSSDNEKNGRKINIVKENILRKL